MALSTVRLALQVTLPQLILDTRLPSVDIEQELPRVAVDIEQPAVLIDLSAPMEEIGLGGIYPFAQKQRDAALMRALASIAEWAQEGDRLREFETGITVGKLIAERLQESYPEINVTALPRTRPAVEVSGGVRISVEEGTLHVDLRRGYVRLTPLLGDVEVAVETAPVTGSRWDVTV